MTEPAPDATPWQPPAANETEPKASPPEPVEPRDDAPGNYRPTRELLITLLAPAAVYLTSAIDVPGLDHTQLDQFPERPPTIAIGALGLTPFISSFMIVEFAAVIFPAWRRLRDGSIAGRASLWRASVILGLVFALLQTWIMVRNFQAISFSGESLILEPTGVWSFTIAATWIGTTIALYVVAQIVDARGLINGFAAVLISSVVFEVFGGAALVLQSGVAEPREVLPGLGIVGVAGWLAAMLFLGKRPWKNVSYGGVVIPRPSSGEAPLSFAASLLILPITVQQFGVDLGIAGKLAPGTTEYAIANAVLIGAGTFFFSWLFNRPERVLHFYPGATLADARAALRLSAIQTFLFLEIISVGYALVAGILVYSIGFAPLFFLVAVILDLRREWRARTAMREPVLVWRDARPYGAHAAISLLEEHGIPVLPRGYYARSLYQFFAPYIPIDLYVPAAHTERAKDLLREPVKET